KRTSSPAGRGPYSTGRTTRRRDSMKRFMVLIALAVAGALGAATAAQAEVVSNTTFPINLSVFVPCANGGAGEVVDLSGSLHDLVTATINGNHVSGKFHDNPQGVTGTGETTGAKYQGTGVTQSEFSGSLTNGQFETTFVNNFH